MEHAPHPHAHILHNVFLEEVQEIMEDLGLDEETAKRIVHENMSRGGDINSPTPDDFLNTSISGCSHCEGGR